MYVYMNLSLFKICQPLFSRHCVVDTHKHTSHYGKDDLLSNKITGLSNVLSKLGANKKNWEGR